MTLGSPKPKPPQLQDASWDGTRRDEDGPIVEYRGSYAVRSNEPRPVRGNKLTQLYHATPFCNLILQADAFLPASETGNAVLGGSTRFDSVSLSGNRIAAAYTAICIADAVCIAKGQVTLAHVLQRVNALGIPLITPSFDGFLQYWTIYTSLPKSMEKADLQEVYNSAATTGSNTPDRVWEAYRAMLHAGCFTKTIPDPGFMRDVSSFANYDHKNIGVVRAKLEPATWICRSAGDADRSLPGAFAYIGINRDIHMPDSDEYRVFDTENLQVMEHYDLQECLEEVENSRWSTFAKSCFIPKSNPYPSPKGKQPITPYELEYNLKRGVAVETGDIEGLYHATVSISGIEKHGFLPRAMLKDKQALGGGPSGAVSMTANKQLACIIAAHLRNIVDIAQGRIHLQDILEMAYQEGNYEKATNLWLKTDDISRYEDDTAEFHLQQLRNCFLSSSVYGGFLRIKDLPPGAFLHPNTKTWKNRAEEDLFTGIYFKELDLLAYRQILIKLYNCFITHLERCENPLFWGLDVLNFINLKPADIGVVEAKLHNGVFYPKADEYDFKKLREAGALAPGAFGYLPSMDEYRVFDYQALEFIRVVDECAPNIC